jgi:hypothetical protein
VNIVGMVRSDPDLAVVVSDPAGILPIGDASALAASSVPLAVLAAVVAPPLGPLGPGSDDLAAAEHSVDPAGGAGDGTDSRTAPAGTARADLGAVALVLLLVIGAGVVIVKRRRIPALRVAMAHRIGTGAALNVTTGTGSPTAGAPATHREAHGG